MIILLEMHHQKVRLSIFLACFGMNGLKLDHLTRNPIRSLAILHMNCSTPKTNKSSAIFMSKYLVGRVNNFFAGHGKRSISHQGM